MKVKVVKIPQQLQNDFAGYVFLSKTASRSLFLKNETVHVDFSDCFVLDVCLCAILGNIIQDLRERGNIVLIKSVTVQVLRALGRNGFLDEFGYKFDLPQFSKNSIPYKRFNLKDETVAKEFFKKQLFDQKGMPNMSEAAQKAVLRSVFEVCVNAITHAGCSFVYCSGEIIRKPINSKLMLTLVDLGKTITANVGSHLKRVLLGNDAIEWALIEGHTTKIGEEPGGLGLKLLQDLIILNKGKLQILSGNGFIEVQNGETKKIGLGDDVSFFGTIVTIEIKLDDPNFYHLPNEITNTSNLF